MMVMNPDVLVAEARECEDAKMVAKLREAVSRDPADHASWFELGMQYYNTDFHEARRCFSRAIALEPFNAVYVFNRGRKCLSADDYEEALADFTMAIRLAPIDGFKWHYLANAYFFLEDYARAAENYRNAIDMHLKTGVHLIPPAVDWSWMCYMHLGQPEKARAILDEFITPDIPVEDSDFDYKKRVLLYAGYTTPDEYYKNIEFGRDVKALTETYALANYYRFIKGDMEMCHHYLKEVLAYKTTHHAFAYKLARKDIKLFEE